jgi:hypothetical protein
MYAEQIKVIKDFMLGMSPNMDIQSNEYLL